MSCSRSVVLLNNALKIAVMKNGDLSERIKSPV